MKTPMPSPRGTNRERLFLSRTPIAAYDEATRGPTRAGLAAALEFLQGKLPEADRREFGRMVESKIGGPEAEDTEASAEEELRQRKIGEALTALQKFAIEKLQADDRTRFDQLVEKLLSAGPMADDEVEAGGEESPLDELLRAREAKDDVPTNGLRNGSPFKSAPAMDGANGDFEKRFPGAARVGLDYFRRG